MAQNTPAPWAELVPGRGAMTVDELRALPEDGWLYELIGGMLVRMPLMGGEQGIVAGNLMSGIHTWVRSIGYGHVFATGTGFQLGPGTVLAGDVAFVRAGREPAAGSTTWERFWHLAPDLVGEVASPGQRSDELEAKAQVWLAAGVRLVWLIWPRRHEAEVWRLDAQGAPYLHSTLKPGDALDGLDVLPASASHWPIYSRERQVEQR